MDVYDFSNISNAGLSPPIRRSRMGEKARSPTSPSLSIQSEIEESNHSRLNGFNLKFLIERLVNH